MQTRYLCVAAGALLACAALSAQPPLEDDSAAPPRAAAEPLTLAEALRRAGADHPSLRAADLSIDVARARRDADALPPPLLFETEIENFAGSGESADFGGAETTLQLAKVLERGNRQALRREVGERRIEQAEIAAEAARLGLALQVAQRFIAVLALQERATLAAQAVELAGETLGIVRSRVGVGRSSEGDAASAEVALSRAELERLSTEQRLETARMSLASLWGAPAADFGAAAGNLYELPAIESFAALEQRLAANPELERLAAELALEQARRRLAESRQRPDLAIAGGVRRLGARDDFGLVFSLSMPFGSAARARPEIAAAELRESRSPLEAEALRRALRARLFGLHQELSLARAAVEALRGSVIPNAARAVALYEEGFALGSSTLLDLVGAQERLLAVRNDTLDAARDYHSTLAEIESLLGGAAGATP